MEICMFCNAFWFIITKDYALDLLVSKKAPWQCVLQPAETFYAYMLWQQIMPF